MSKDAGRGKRNSRNRRVNESVPKADVPERAAIIEVLEGAGRPLDFKSLVGALRVKGNPARHAFQRRLKAMIRDGQLIQNRREEYCLPEKVHLVVGRVQGHADGFGFLIPDAGGDDVWAKVLAALSDKLQGKPIRVLDVAIQLLVQVAHDLHGGDQGRVAQLERVGPLPQLGDGQLVVVRSGDATEVLADPETVPSLGPREAGGFGLTVDLEVSLPGLDDEVAQKVVDQAHQACPYSNATRGNIDVGLTLV